MKKTKIALIVGAIMMFVGVIGGIGSSIVVFPSVLSDINESRTKYNDERIKSIYSSKENFKTLNMNFDSISNVNYNIKIKKSVDGTFSIKTKNTPVDVAKINATYNKEESSMDIEASMEYKWDVNYSGITEFLAESYNYVIDEIASNSHERVIEIYLPTQVSLNVKVNSFSEIIIEDGSIIKDKISIEGGTNVNIPKNLNVKELIINRTDNISLDLKDILNIEKIKLQSGYIYITSSGELSEYINMKNIPLEMSLNSSNVEIISYIPISKKLTINSNNVSIKMPFEDYKIKTTYSIADHDVHYEEWGFNEKNLVIQEEKNNTRGFVTKGAKYESDINIKSNNITLYNENSEFFNLE